MLINQGALTVPEGADVAAFVKYGGKPPPKASGEGRGENPEGRQTTLASFATQHLKARSGSSMEANSLATARMHFGHIERTLGGDFDLRG